MAARAIWRGVITLRKARVPVRLYSAVADHDVHFRLLHAKDKAPVSQRMVNPKTEKTVPRQRIRKGFEVEGGLFVLLDTEELAELEPEPSRAIEVTRFVEPAAIPPQYYDRPYWLGPDGDVKAYFALVEALAASGLDGILRWTMRKKRYGGVLRSDGEHLSLVSLRPSDEVVAASEIKAPPGRATQAAERKMAEQLVAALEGPFDPTEFRDEFRERVLELVERKKRGGKIRRPRRVEPAPREVSLERALAQSLRAAQKERKTA
jgi:DNA end-binding protein Ku